MKAIKKMGFIAVVALNMTLIGITALSTSFAQPQVKDWKDVCCGSTCGTEKYCYGDGEYKCCK